MLVIRGGPAHLTTRAKSAPTMHYALSTIHSFSPAFAVFTDAVNKLMTSFISARCYDFDKWDDRKFGGCEHVFLATLPVRNLLFTAMKTKFIYAPEMKKDILEGFLLSK